VQESQILEIYTPFSFADFASIIISIKTFAAQGQQGGAPTTAIVSTINGDANTYFYQELARQGITSSVIPCVAFSVGEGEISGYDDASILPLVGQMAAWNYFMSINTSENAKFLSQWIPYSNYVANDPIEAHYIGFKMWVQAVIQTGTTDVDTVRQAMYGQTVTSLSGYQVVMDTNHHLHKPVMLGRIRADRQFDIISQSTNVVAAQPWSPYIATNANETCNWAYPYVCSRCSVPVGRNFSVDSLFY